MVTVKEREKDREWHETTKRQGTVLCLDNNHCFMLH